VKENLIQQRSYALALAVIPLCRELQEKQKEYVLSRQLMKSGTSVGSNVEEAQGGQSRADFLSKMSIASKEARETHYWLRLVRDSKLLSEKTVTPVLDLALEVRRILSAIVKTTGKR
jgi:four helix bundle protein